jgi:hypothetical protein
VGRRKATRQSRVKKKSSHERVTEGAGGTAHAPPAAAAEVLIAAEINGGPEPEPEENIYEVMKQHMARKREELEAQQAQRRLGHHGHGPHVPAAAAAPKPVEKAADLTDWAGVWIAARNYLAMNARLLESVLGHCTSIAALSVSTNEVTLLIPRVHTGFANDKAKARLEEALRAVTDLPLKLSVQFSDQPLPVPSATAGGGIGTIPLAAAQRVPPEVMDAVKKQPIVRELMKRLDATVTQVEILEEGAEGE